MDNKYAEQEDKTLTILIGNARGGEKTWNTLYENLLNPYNSDLALCFGEIENKNISLYQKAKYVWEVPEYKNWRDYYSNVCSGYWEQSFSLGQNDGLMGGIDNNIGSGSIIFAFRHFLKNNKKNILNQYDRIILTRSDFYYAHKQQLLSNQYFWIVEGEDYGGFGDRMHIFPSSIIDNVLGIVEYMDSEIGYNQILNYEGSIRNPELLLKLYFTNNKVSDKIKRFPRVNYTVAVEEDSTRWREGKIQDPNNFDLLIKYYDEYIDSINNISQNKIVDLLD
jgi:hypothetical protein